MMKQLLLAVCAIAFMGMQSAYLQTHTTSFFRIKYEKSVSSQSATKLGSMLESAHAKFKKKFNVTLTGRADVMLYNSADRMKKEAKMSLFDDGVYGSGKIYMVALSNPSEEQKISGMVSRVAARCVLNEIKGCPYWLAECYSVYAGEELMRFGSPSRPNMLSFADLAEDFSRAERLDEYREVYAKLASTASFFTNRYGEQKFEGVFTQLKNGKSFEEAFEASFGEKMNVIEKAWSKSLAVPGR